jgi:glucose/arabinose dehydrogenase
MLGANKKEVWGRPVGLLQLRDGSVLVSDDGGKVIWRMSYKKG